MQVNQKPQVTLDEVAELMSAVYTVEKIKADYSGEELQALERVLTCTKLNIYLWANRKGFKDYKEFDCLVKSYLLAKKGRRYEPLQKTKRRSAKEI